MVTAKNLQLLDTQGNNISPAVNLETLYYEETVNNTVYRKHIFKHFPVYVKYNGKPEVQHAGTLFTSETIYDKILTYEQTEWPENAPVQHTDISGIIGNDSEILWTSQSAPYEYTNPDSGADILVSGLTQNRLSPGNDFMRLDVSAYNLTQILEPYAYKNWVNVNFAHYETMLKNADIYNSGYLLDQKHGDKKYIAIRKQVGSILPGTDPDTINGLRYNEVIDRMLFGPLNPDLMPGVINANINTVYHITDQDLLKYNKTYETDGYKCDTKNAFGTGSLSVILPETPTNPAFTNWENSNNPISICNEILIYAGQSNTTNAQNKGVYRYTFPIPKLTDKQYVKTTAFSYKLTMVKKPDEVLQAITNSVGEQKYTNLTQLTTIQPPVKIKAKYPDIDGPVQETLKHNIINTKIPFDTTVEVRWPIKFGYGLEEGKLKTMWITPGKVGKIRAIWDPVKSFYICIPRIVTCMLHNPMPMLRKILQNGKWVTASNWIISSVTTPVPTTQNKLYSGLAAYTVYKIQPLGTGANKHIEFGVNLTELNIMRTPYVQKTLKKETI